MKALRWLGKNSLEADRLTSPASDNAYYYYSRLLNINPSSRAAIDGIERIAERYVALAEQAVGRKDYEQAAAYTARGLEVQPNHSDLLQIKALVEEGQQKRFKDILKGDK